MTDWIAAVLLVAGGVFLLGAGAGLLRLPDVLSRLHAASMAGSLGAGLPLVAVAVAAEDGVTRATALAGVLFLLLTGAVGAHLLARAAYRSGEPLWHRTTIDDLNDRRPPEEL